MFLTPSGNRIHQTPQAGMITQVALSPAKE